VKYILASTILLAACSSPSSIAVDDWGFDETLREMDQTGWGCASGHWHVWMYYESLDDVSYVNAAFFAEDESALWGRRLGLSDPNYYEAKYFDLTRHCQPYDVKYTLYYEEREPESIWLRWNDEESGN